jgi:hypothetical protein
MIGSVIRHAICLISFLLAWNFLSRWYFYQHSSDYLIFLIFYVTAVLLAVYWVLPNFKTFPASRWVLAFGILLLTLPWGEWLALSFDSSSEDWTRKLFLQTVFIYAVLLILHLLKSFVSVLAKRVRTWLHAASERPVVIWLPALLFFLISCWISLVEYGCTPLVEDSAAHLFQAKIFHAGHLWAPAPPLPDFFSYQGDMLVMKDGRWFGMYQPGFAALLALAMFVRAEWLLSPLLGSAILAIWIAYCKRWYGAQTALLFGWIALFSPFLLVMSSTVMVHTPELFLASLLVYLCRREVEKPDVWRRVAISFSLAVAVLVRGFSLLAFMLPVLIFVAIAQRKLRQYTFSLWCIGGIFLGLVILGFYQRELTGNFLQSGYKLEYPELRYGFGKSLAGQVHTPLRGLENTSNNFNGINFWLNGWYSGSIFFLILFCLFEKQFEKWDVVLSFSALSLILFYYFYVAQTLVLGPRSYYILAPLLIFYIVRSVAIERPLSRYSDLSLTFLLFTFLLSLPLQGTDLIREWSPRNYQAGFLNQELKQENGKKLIFLTKRVSQAFVNWNDPYFKGGAILARDLGEANKKAVDSYTDHTPVYFLPNTGLKGGFAFKTTPEDRPNGFVSSFELSMALQAGRDYPDKDSFDICYTDLFDPSEASLHLAYIEKELRAPDKEEGYRKNFRLGVLHAGRLILLPCVEFEKSGAGWKSKFDSEQFRNEFDTTVKFLQDAGEVGKTIVEQLQKVGKRIDKNGDGSYSDSELKRFLARKLKLMEVR